MSKLRVVVFDNLGAKILVNPENPEQYKGCSNVLINPSQEKVLGLAPHLWKLQNGEIVPLEAELHDARTAAASGKPLAPKPRKKLWRRLLPLVYALLGAAAALAIQAQF